MSILPNETFFNTIEELISFNVKDKTKRDNLAFTLEQIRSELSFNNLNSKAFLNKDIKAFKMKVGDSSFLVNRMKNDDAPFKYLSRDKNDDVSLQSIARDIDINNCLRYLNGCRKLEHRDKLDICLDYIFANFEDVMIGINETTVKYICEEHLVIILKQDKIGVSNPAECESMILKLLCIWLKFNFKEGGTIKFDELSQYIRWNMITDIKCELENNDIKAEINEKLLKRDCKMRESLDSEYVIKKDKYSIGNIVDAIDGEGSWYVSKINDIKGTRDQRQYLIHYSGWAERWDTWLKETSLSVLGENTNGIEHEDELNKECMCGICLKKNFGSQN